MKITRRHTKAVNVASANLSAQCAGKRGPRETLGPTWVKNA